MTKSGVSRDPITRVFLLEAPRGRASIIAVRVRVFAYASCADFILSFATRLMGWFSFFLGETKVHISTLGETKYRPANRRACVVVMLLRCRCALLQKILGTRCA